MASSRKGSIATSVARSEATTTDGGAVKSTTRYTNDEWTKFIAQVEKDIVISSEPCPCPDVGGPALAQTIDHTLLKLEARAVQFDDLCAEARVNGFATVCVRPQWVHKCAVDLRGSNVKVACVIGFHEGTHDLLHKAQEAKQALRAGASELDIVLNYPELQTAQYASIYTELATLRLQAPHPTLLKLILETSQLTPSEIIAACAMAAAANFDFVKTSTGFRGAGANEADVRLMAACCERLGAGVPADRRMRVKASGGIRTIEDAVKMLEAGASRLGTSGGVWIVKEGRETAEQSRGLSPPVAEGFERRGSRPGLETRLFTDY
ncbi:hypothetical protein LTR91_004437 [Friedmanniomyces endolithicus]|uniref:deoxyribose-phosphate aldolase n=1 Tax=Friedmanniomyces endolithicus TaxID=329885 RepID=A0AAN6KWR1_9PEZI|nr:hypothetical protein LTR94_020275 [Friedmanniomyces endolithicus]KAK0774031.1 hypothetical protein LTR59_015045 [Friedmanniomyces endolithicus]KAK0778624.1 hypothetical protein LTR75_015595 [Friedmanniomyces endolithicus]KAK0781499.1 hypothetical protein LTR38_013719 [Friedmanniomyces endolithicus]KAK0824068.1 hypothetical protein LTR03_017818 [Friedmanniomyces endolithicus]